MEIEELFTLECFETGKIISHSGKKIFTKEEAEQVFAMLTEEQKRRFRLVSQEE